MCLKTTLSSCRPRSSSGSYGFPCMLGGPQPLTHPCQGLRLNDFVMFASLAALYLCATEPCTSHRICIISFWALTPDLQAAPRQERLRREQQWNYLRSVVGPDVCPGSMLDRSVRLYAWHVLSQTLLSQLTGGSLLEGAYQQSRKERG